MNITSSYILEQLRKYDDFKQCEASIKVLFRKWGQKIIQKEDVLSCFVSGSAVASIILEKDSDKKYPFNDIDIFIIKKVPAAQFLQFQEHSKMGGGIGYPVIEEFVLYKQEQEGIVNLVEYWIKEGNVSDNLIKRLISNFDLNYAHVAIDLNTEELIYDEYFENFIETNSLEIVNCLNDNLIKTFIRALVKKDEWSLSFFDKEFLDVLSLYFNLQTAGTNRYMGKVKLYKHTRKNNLITDKQFEKMDKYLSYFSSIFSVFYKPKEQLEIDYSPFLEHYKADVTNNDFFSLLSESSCIVMDGQGVEFKLSASQVKHVQSNLLSLLSPVKNIGKLQEIVKQYNKGSRYLKYKKTFFIRKNICSLEQLVDEDFWKEDFHINEQTSNKISKLIDSHPRLSMLSSLLYKKLKFGADKIISFYKKVEKTNDMMFLGFLENSTEADIVKLASSFESENLREIFDFFIAKNPDLTKPLQDKIDISEFKFSSKVRQMMCQLDLKYEGKFMNHCVSGYGQTLVKGDCIFHLNHGSFHSTIHYTSKIVDGIKEYSVSQHRAKFNAEPNYRLKIIADTLGEYLKFNQAITLLNKDFKNSLTVFISNNFPKKDIIGERELDQSNRKLLKLLAHAQIIEQNDSKEIVFNREIYNKFIV